MAGKSKSNFIDVENCKKSDLWHEVAAEYTRYSKVISLHNASSDVAQIKRWLRWLNQLHDSTSLFLNEKRFSAALKGKPSFSSYKSLRYDISRVRYLVGKQISALKARVEMTRMELRKLEADSQAQSSYRYAKERHKVEDAIVSEFLFYLSQRLGGAGPVFRMFKRFPDMLPIGFPMPNSDATIRSRINRRKGL
jgi:hypothetical protein